MINDKLQPQFTCLNIQRGRDVCDLTNDLDGVAQRVTVCLRSDEVLDDDNSEAYLLTMVHCRCDSVRSPSCV